MVYLTILLLQTSISLRKPIGVFSFNLSKFLLNLASPNVLVTMDGLATSESADQIANPVGIGTKYSENGYFGSFLIDSTTKSKVLMSGFFT